MHPFACAVIAQDAGRLGRFHVEKYTIAKLAKINGLAMINGNGEMGGVKKHRFNLKT